MPIKLSFFIKVMIKVHQKIPKFRKSAHKSREMKIMRLCQNVVFLTMGLHFNNIPDLAPFSSRMRAKVTKTLTSSKQADLPCSNSKIA